MTKEEAIYNFFASFGWPAYEQTTVPDDAAYPYITYEVATDSIGTPVYTSAYLWDRTTSWGSVTRKAQEIAHRIVTQVPPALKIDGGRLYIAKGTPFTRHGDSGDDSVRKLDLNLAWEFLTNY